MQERRAAEEAPPENASGDGEAGPPPPYPTRTADGPDPTARPVPRSDIPDDYNSDRLPNDYPDRLPNNPDRLPNDPDRLPNYLDPLPKDPDSFPNDPDSLSTYSDSLLDDLYPDVYYMGPDYDEYGTDGPDPDNQTDPYGNNMYPGDPPHAEYSAPEPLDSNPADTKWSPYPEHEPHPPSDVSEEFSAQEKLDWAPPAEGYPYPDPEQAPHSPNEGSGGVPFPETEYPPRRFSDDPAGDPPGHPEPAWDSPPVDPEPESFPDWEPRSEPEDWAQPEPGRFRRHARPEPEWEPNPDPEAWDPPADPEWDPEPRPESSEEWTDPEPEWEPRPGSSSKEEWAQPEQEPRPGSSEEWDPPVDYEPEGFPESRPESEEWAPPVDPEPEWYPEQEPHPGSEELANPESEWGNRPGSEEWASPADPEPEWYPEPEERDPLADPEPEWYPEEEPQPESEEWEPRPGYDDAWASAVDRPTGKYPRSLPGSRPYIGETDQRPLLEHPDWVGDSAPLPSPGQLPDSPANPPIEPYNPANPPIDPENPANPPIEPYNPANPPMEHNNPANPSIEANNPPIETNNPANPPMANNSTAKMTDSLQSDFARAKRSLSHGNAKHKAHRLADFPPHGNPKPHPHADQASRAPNPGRDAPKAERDGPSVWDEPSGRDGPPGEDDPVPLKRKRHGKTSRARGDKPAHMAAKLY
ncbi:PREDICTED: pollen-specific leucine-rich repeat extensin-like protein 1 [Branchiostoma belcheri]|uniref:Pollen-specific leucine-rich repeat extensin-like protein 1 n=1 Tax=Branchiostoma belcheri TaxID=7741 RepID=A0A6P5A7S3_BRABE|nr:PREDICTED: pollen-specific leucine-rich repeat extensin-like protein 1 [Branchiostoma belcheri]